jgi:hypothetical protein
MADALKAVDSARKVFSKRGGMLRTVRSDRDCVHVRQCVGTEQVGHKG